MPTSAPKLRASAVERPALSGLIGYQLRRVSSQSMSALEVAFADIGLRVAHYTVLSTVQADPGSTQNQICRSTNMRPGNLVPLIGDLVRRGFIVRERDGNDKRVVRVQIEPAGREVVDEMHRRVLEHESRFYGPLNADEKAVLMALLGRLGTSEAAANQS